MLIASNINQDISLVARELAASEMVFIEKDDNAAIARLQEQAGQYDPSAHGGKRLEVYLILQEATALWQLQTQGIPKNLQERVDLVATTINDLTAKSIFIKLPGVSSIYPSLDRIPITRDSETTVHLVLIGLNQRCEALALNAALVAHYPNYCRDTRLRTRITIIDEDIHASRDALLQRYNHLFDNSYYRMLDLNDKSPKCHVHRPMYEGQRQDFVDIEWEFVNGRLSNNAIRQKLSQWSASSRQQLTIALCHDDETRCYVEAMSLPEDVYQQQIPILCYSEHNDLLGLLNDGINRNTIFPYGTQCANLDQLKKLKEMARCVNAVYHHCFALPVGVPVTAPASIDKQALEDLWRNVDVLPKVYSNIFNAMTMGTKMHSIGHDSNDWSAYYALSREEIDLLTEVEHNRWCVEELILGYRPVTDAEQQLVEEDINQKKVLRSKKIHYDLRAYNDLREDSTGKNANIYDMALTQSIPLIIKTCITN